MCSSGYTHIDDQDLEFDVCNVKWIQKTDEVYWKVCILDNGILYTNPTIL